jgi:hypothetical protein
VVRAEDVLTVTATVANHPSTSSFYSSVWVSVGGLGKWGLITPCNFGNAVQVSGNDSLAVFATSCYIGMDVGGAGLINGRYTASVVLSGYDGNGGYNTLYGQPVPFQVVDAMDPLPGPIISDVAVTLPAVVVAGSTVNISAIIVDPMGRGIESSYLNVTANDIFVGGCKGVNHPLVPVSPYTDKYVGALTVRNDINSGVHTFSVAIVATSADPNYVQSVYHKQMTFTVRGTTCAPTVSRPPSKAKAKRGSGASASMHKSIGTFIAQSLSGLLGVCLYV